MRLTFPTEAEAQTKADAIHAHMIATWPEYAKSVTEGRTLAFAIPYQDLDKDGKPFGDWYLNFKERHLDALSAQERSALVPVKR